MEGNDADVKKYSVESEYRDETSGLVVDMYVRSMSDADIPTKGTIVEVAGPTHWFKPYRRYDEASVATSSMQLNGSSNLRFEILRSLGYEVKVVNVLERGQEKIDEHVKEVVSQVVASYSK